MKDDKYDLNKLKTQPWIR